MSKSNQGSQHSAANVATTKSNRFTIKLTALQTCAMLKQQRQYIWCMMCIEAQTYSYRDTLKNFFYHPIKGKGIVDILLSQMLLMMMEEGEKTPKESQYSKKAFP